MMLSAQQRQHQMKAVFPQNTFLSVDRWSKKKEEEEIAANIVYCAVCQQIP